MGLGPGGQEPWGDIARTFVRTSSLTCLLPKRAPQMAKNVYLTGSVSLGKLRGITNIIHLPQSQYAESLVESNISVKSFPNSKSWWKHPKVSGTLYSSSRITKTYMDQIGSILGGYPLWKILSRAPRVSFRGASAYNLSRDELFQ